jgi:hypothetical protein
MAAAKPRAPIRTDVLALAMLATAFLAIIPVYATRFLPINDYPFHLARMAILAQLDNPIFSRFYEQGSFFLPNMAMDAIAVPLSRFLGPELATRVFVELTLLTILFGVVVLHWAAHRRPSFWPLLAVVLLHNGIFRYGFLNYLFGMGLALWFAALWIVMKPGLGRLVMAFIASNLLIYCHMEAFGVFGVIVGSIEIEREYETWRRSKSWKVLGNLLYSASPFLLAIALFALLSPTAAVAGKGFAYSTGWGTKPVGGLFSLSSGVLWLDAGSGVCIAAMLAWLAVSGNLVISKSLAAASIMMGLAFFAVPSSVMGALYADVRIGPAIALLVIATFDLKRDAHRSASFAVLALVLALGAVRAGVLTKVWAGYSSQIAVIVDVIDKLEPGSTLFAATSEEYPTLIADTPQRRAAWSPSLKHVGCYAILGGPVFVPMTWADPTQQPLNVKAAYQGPYVFQGNNPRKIYDPTALPKFIATIQENVGAGNWTGLGNVYVLVIHSQGVETGPFPQSVSLVSAGNRFALLRLNASSRARGNSR